MLHHRAIITAARNLTKEVNEEVTMKEEVTIAANKTIYQMNKIPTEVAVACNEDTVVDTTITEVIANATFTLSLYLTTTENNVVVEAEQSSVEVVAVELDTERKETTEVHAQVGTIYLKNSRTNNNQEDSTNPLPAQITTTMT